MVIYYALFQPDKDAGGFVVTFPDIGYGATQGETMEEAVHMAQDLLKCSLQDFIERDEDLPAPRSCRGRHYKPVSLAALHSVKAELYAAFRKSGIRKAEFARRMGIPKTTVDRLFDLDHRSRMDQLESALRVLGKSLTVRVEDAA